MSLDKSKLQSDLLAMMTSAREQGWTPGQVAEAMAGAIDSYVRGGEVKGVTIKVGDQAYRQTDTVKVQ